jgi:hypothetical protein
MVTMYPTCIFVRYDSKYDRKLSTKWPNQGLLIDKTVNSGLSIFCQIRHPSPCSAMMGWIQPRTFYKLCTVLQWDADFRMLTYPSVARIARLLLLLLRNLNSRNLLNIQDHSGVSNSMMVESMHRRMFSSIPDLQSDRGFSPRYLVRIWWPFQGEREIPCNQSQEHTIV